MQILSALPGILVILLGFGVLIFVHELGHFLAAKWAGIRTEGFAVGMGPVVCAWRKGVGFTVGSTEKRVVALAGKPAAQLTDAELERHGLGETEYSLRYLPLGGFVKMLGQEDANPTAVSDDPRSYNVCPVGKRMVVVSAGVIMNVILAMVFFGFAFMGGVQAEKPVVGQVSRFMPAGVTLPDDAAELGITTPGLLPGDVFTRIDGKPVRNFMDVLIGSAMARPDVDVVHEVDRNGQALTFTMRPEVDPASGLLGIGVMPAKSAQLFGDEVKTLGLPDLLDRTGLAAAGVAPGMVMISADGVRVDTYEGFQLRVQAAGGAPVRTQWQRLDPETGAAAGPIIDADVAGRPEFEVLRYPELAADGKRDFERGLLGLVPLPRVERVSPGSANRDVIREGDVILRVGSVEGPTHRDLVAEIRRHARRDIDLTVLRDGAVLDLVAAVNRRGEIGFNPGYAWDTPRIATPFERIAVPASDAPGMVTRATPIAALEVPLPPRAEIIRVGTAPIGDWRDLYLAFRDAAAGGGGEATTVPVTFRHPTPDASEETVVLILDPDAVAALGEAGWLSDLPSYAFEPIYTTLSADGNPITAVTMGFGETHKVIMMTYLTIDRLIRGSVGVEQLRGPVGIIDLGAKILPKGFMYFIFFLGMISVNLAVINFLPLPIVDGGLFLFLIYEKIKGKPPSIQFQNLATVVGLFLIGTIFVVTFYNDIMRLL